MAIKPEIIKAIVTWIGVKEVLFKELAINFAIGLP
jgi:hypothetical protein